MQSIVTGKVENNKIFLLPPNQGGIESRCDSVMALFTEAFNKIKGSFNFKDTVFFINTWDASFIINNQLTFGFTQGENVVACPDFTFDKWVETGIENFESVVDNIIKRGKEPYSVNKLFWIGTLFTQQLRYKLHDLGQLYKDDFEIISMEWIKEHAKGHKHKQTQYVSLPDHCNYKYLIDCGAGGWSARLKFLLFTNRPLFLVERDINKQDYFYHQLKPYVHYIPLWQDLSNLRSQYEWAENNYDKACEIAKNAQKFAVENLNKEEALMYLANQMLLQFT